MTSGIWLPGAQAPSQDEFVERIHERIRRFAAEQGVEQPVVEVELGGGGERFALQAIAPEPGFGFVTLTPDPMADGDPEPEQLIVPVGLIARIVISTAAHRRGRLGFALPSA